LIAVPETTLRRKRGGQPGNTNALKHGFYSRQFRALELQDLDVLGRNLESEISLLRVTMRRVLELADFDAGDLEVAIDIMNALGCGAVRVSTLMKAQAILVGDEDQVMKMLSSALEKVNSEWVRK
jgi:hypothetical protein